MIFSHWGGNVSVRTQQYRLDAMGKLFDMIADPGQQRDISKQVPATAAQLTQAVADWKREVLSEMKREVQPFTVGYPQFPSTQLPARDGVPVGGIRRSAKAPNCSYFTNWTSLDDRLTWDIDVHTAGRYDVAIYYACSAANLGSTIELSFGSNRLTGEVTVAHDSPPYGAEHDRYPREGESLMRDFRLMKLGEIDLTQGHGLLSLRTKDSRQGSDGGSVGCPDAEKVAPRQTQRRHFTQSTIACSGRTELMRVWATAQPNRLPTKSRMSTSVIPVEFRTDEGIRPTLLSKLRRVRLEIAAS